MWNFLEEEDGFCYGYCMTLDKSTHVDREDPHGVDLGRLVGRERVWKLGEVAENIDVVFISTNPRGGRYVVGWYKNATVFHKYYNHEKEEREPYGYLCRVESENAFLVKDESKRIKIPSDLWSGTRYLYYVDDEHSADFAQWFREYMSQSIGGENGVIPARIINKEKIREIEKKAVDRVTEHYEEKGCTVKSVEAEKCGWDLTATGEDTLYIEVKGHEGPTVQFELTPNEYKKMQEHHQNYRVCVVCSTLSDNFQLIEAYPCQKNGKWFLREVEGSRDIRLEEKIAAVASKDW